jgi:large subunit ribosomal protein L23
MKSEKTKKNTKEVEATDAKKVKTHPLIKSPRITEKAALGSEKGIYTFNVADEANKNEVKKAINLIYGVMPKRVSIIQIKEKRVVRRGIVGKRKGGKKAVVFLKKGDKIAFV